MIKLKIFKINNLFIFHQIKSHILHFFIFLNLSKHCYDITLSHKEAFEAVIDHLVSSFHHIILMDGLYTVYIFLETRFYNFYASTYYTLLINSTYICMYIS